MLIIDNRNFIIDPHHPTMIIRSNEITKFIDVPEPKINEKDYERGKKKSLSPIFSKLLKRI